MRSEYVPEEQTGRHADKSVKEHQPARATVPSQITGIPHVEERADTQIVPVGDQAESSKEVRCSYCLFTLSAKESYLSTYHHLALLSLL